MDYALSLLLAIPRYFCSSLVKIAGHFDCHDILLRRLLAQSEDMLRLAKIKNMSFRTLVLGLTRISF